MTAQPRLTLPGATGRVIAAEVRRFGRRGVETGGFLLAPEGQQAVTIVAFAGEIGIVRRRLFFQVSALALDQLFGFAGERACWVPGQFHSHATGAFLSFTDQEQGLRVQGFTSAVIPHFADPPAESAAWGWWRFAGEDWRPCQAPCTDGADVEVVIFDEDGVRGQ